MDAAARFWRNNQDAPGAAAQVQDYGRDVPPPLRREGVRRVPYLRTQPACLQRCFGGGRAPARPPRKPLPSRKFKQETVPVAQAAESFQGESYESEITRRAGVYEERASVRGVAPVRGGRNPDDKGGAA